MKRILLASLALLFMAPALFAADATSIVGIPINPPPAGYPNPAYQPCPNCASLTGLVPIYRAEINGGAGGFQLNVPQVAGGPSALIGMGTPPNPGSIPVNFQLVNNTWNFVDTDPVYCSTPPLPLGYCGFRGGLAAYPNGGWWNMRDGIATFAGKSGTIYYIGVFVGTYLEPHTGSAQPDMLTGGPAHDHYQYVGGGFGQATGPDNYIFQVHFSAHLILCPANGPSDSGQIGPVACEIRVAVYPQTPAGTFNAILGIAGSPPGGGSVGPLPSAGGVPQGYVTNFYLEQERGL